MTYGERFPNWERPRFDERGMTRWGWMVQHPDNLKLSHGCDIGAFTYINALNGVTIGPSAQVGSHCSIYSVSTIDGTAGPVVIDEGARIGSHSVIMPGVRIGKWAVVGACSFVKEDIPSWSLAYGTPAKVVGHSADAQWNRDRRAWLEAIEREKSNA